MERAFNVYNYFHALALIVVSSFGNLHGQRNIRPTTTARIKPRTLAPSTTPPVPACPARYSSYSESCGRFCYRYEPSNCIDWNNARRACQAEGGDLLAPSDCSYEFFRVRAGQNIGECPENIRLGALQPTNGANFRTMRGDPISNTANFWETDQPDNRDGNENCLEMRRNLAVYRANDQICSQEHGYICQIII